MRPPPALDTEGRNTAGAPFFPRGTAPPSPPGPASDPVRALAVAFQVATQAYFATTHQRLFPQLPHLGSVCPSSVKMPRARSGSQFSISSAIPSTGSTPPTVPYRAAHPQPTRPPCSRLPRSSLHSLSASKRASLSVYRQRTQKDMSQPTAAPLEHVEKYQPRSPFVFEWVQAPEGQPTPMWAPSVESPAHCFDDIVADVDGLPQPLPPTVGCVCAYWQSW